MSTEPQYTADDRSRLTQSIEACLQSCETPEAVEIEINRLFDYLAHRTYDAMDDLRDKIAKNKLALEAMEGQPKFLVETLEARIEIEQQQSHPAGWQRFLELVLVILLSASVATCWTHNKHSLPTTEPFEFPAPDDQP